jgi:hypothetical protein
MTEICYVNRYKFINKSDFPLVSPFKIIIFAIQKKITIQQNKRMEISGKIIAILPQTTGQGKNGMWRSQDYVLETGDQYPKKVCFNLFNDKIDQFPIAIDDQVNISFDIESREYNGRWYTTVRAWKIDKNAGQAGAPIQQQAVVNAPAFDAAPAAGGEGSDLPF